jgi:cell division protein FtsB
LQLRDEDFAGPRLVEEATEDAVHDARARRGSLFTIPLVCLGLAVLAACLLIPAVDQNRRMAYDREQLRRDLAHLDQQVAVNDEFLRKLADDPTLAERLARRQLNAHRDGTRVLALPESSGSLDAAALASPYALLHVAPPPPLPAYQPVGGRLGELCLDPKSRLYLMGGAMLCIVAGLLLGTAGRSQPLPDKLDRQ